MSLSWRITTTFDDRSQRAIASSASGTGATVVAGSRSLEEPILFARGETQRMLNLLGTPTRQDQGLLEAIEFNKSYPLYCVSPAKTKKFNYIAFRRANNYILAQNMGDYMVSQSIDSAGAYSCGMDFTNGTGGSPTCTLGVTEEELASALIYASDTTEPLSVSVSTTAITPTGEETLTGTVSGSEGSYTLTITNLGSHTGASFRLVYTRTMGNDTYLILVQRGSGNFIQGSITKNILKKGTQEGDNTYYLSFNYQVLNYLGNYQTGSKSPVSFALEKGAVDGFQNSLNAETKFASNDYFKAIYNPRLVGNTGMFQYSLGEDMTPPTGDDALTLWSFNLNGVTRSYTEDEGPLADTDIMGGYAFFHKVNSYQPDMFFDATGSQDAVTELEDIRNNYHQYSRVLVPMYTEDPEDVDGAIEKINSFPANRGFSVYWGEFEIDNPYSTEAPSFQGVPMGSIAVRHSDAISLSYGGLATAWIDENGVGGQLSGTRLIRGLADPSEEQLKLLDENRINPVIYDDTYGPMILSRRTTYTDYSDYSFNDYSGIIDYCVKNIIKNALPYQIVKLNDPTHRAIVRNRIDSILRPLTVVPYNVIREYAIKCDSENNTDEVMANEEFLVEVGIKVTPKSRTIKLIFTNVGQTMTVEEALA